MRLDYVHNEDCDSPVIRLHGFTTREAALLHAAVSRLADGSQERVSVHALPGVESIENCKLTLCVGQWDQGVIRKSNASFECQFTAETWDNVAGLIEPFMQKTNGFQWLAGGPCEAAVLLSANGVW